MGSKSTIVESLTAAQIPRLSAAPSTTFLEQLAPGLRINKESGPARPSYGQAGFGKELICLTSTIAQIEQFAKAGDSGVRSYSERFVAVRVALENMSASYTATHDRDLALQIARLTKAQILSLTPLRPHINCISRKRS